MTYETLIVETRGAVGLVILNRPKALNALNALLVAELHQALDAFEVDPVIGAIVIAGGEKAFAAGADIKEMKDRDFADVYLADFITKDWERLAQCRKPTIAAVAGYALGGGCEIAMMCDIVLAADNAKFGQPEITLGTLPGAGGTQRLARALGKAKTMDLVLTGRMMDAAEAERSGLVARVLPAPELLAEALKMAEKIAHFSRPAVLMAKEAVNQAFETGLAEGLRFERRLFHASFATADQKEGMGAFAEKRSPQFRNR
jgi:enoyl-CoA hydratase